MGQSTRPTADRVRQALFDRLEHAPWAPPLRGARVVDLFAGSGALGLEALSRGADFCLFVDEAAAARRAIGDNLAALGLEAAARVERHDAARLGPRPAAAGAPFDLAFLDPPYGKGLAGKALERLACGGWLAEGALAAVEQGAREPAEVPPAFVLVGERSWGAARVSFLSFSPTPV